MRTTYQGVGNILRFNWPFFAWATAGVVGAVTLGLVLGGLWTLLFMIGALGIVMTTLISLYVSHWVYDRSGLYELNWLGALPPRCRVVNIHAGLDETSALLMAKFEDMALTVFDFYDPEKHTEVSIERARKAYPPEPGTRQISTEAPDLAAGSLDRIFLTLSAHEIREEEERIEFFRSLGMALAPHGEIWVTEHLRDRSNFLAYTIGFFHFHSKATWLRTFDRAELQVLEERKHTPFLSHFRLRPT